MKLKRNTFRKMNKFSLILHNKNSGNFDVLLAKVIYAKLMLLTVACIVYLKGQEDS